ncbi:MAG TPA: sigma 54-interacting transcriptional regulator [Pyrinomonadaceae bacterium]|jgi:Nif-specific regulatory protein|nr:sigma 54-interacting transcriptional regulator [Pyrinomonadaceae bacterium]
MNARLIVIGGSLKGTILNLTDPEISVGRDVGNTVRLNETSVSRRHCLISQCAGEPDIFTISDLDSFNGTFVNSLPIKEQTLTHGDQIALGDVVLLFLIDDEAGSGHAPTSDEGNLITRSTIRLRREDAVYLRPEKLLTEARATDRVTRDLNALLKISRGISSIRDVAELHRELFKLMLEIIPAERALILLADNLAGTFTSIKGWNTKSGPDDSFRGSNTIINQVLQDEVALLSNDLLSAESTGTAPSLVTARVCSVLCVPLAVFEKPLGVIYLDSSNPGSRFDEDHLQLLTAVGGIAASALENARHFEWFANETQRLQEEIRVQHQMIGQSAAMQAVYEFIGKVAPTDSTVLIRGESGTGKELAAHAIHLNSPRTDKPFIAINGATLSESLLESELFGHEKGAFTGAIAQKRGKLELADGGTLFLDEVGELTPLIQAKLLRVLQEREFERVGGARPIKVDVRIVTATNRNLEEAVAKGEFRQDLYYRLNVLSVTMPALRDRKEDIQLLASYFACRYSKKCKRRIDGISPEARALLRGYDWPGNVRELENAIERAVVLGSAEMILSDDLPEILFEMDKSEGRLDNYHHLVKEAKSLIVMRAIEEAGGNFTEAAKRLGLHPTNLHRLIRHLKLRSKLKGDG